MDWYSGRNDVSNPSKDVSEGRLKTCIDRDAFWNSIHTLAIQERALYSAIDYSKSSVQIGKAKRKQYYAKAKKHLYLFFLVLLIFDFMNVTLCATFFRSWKLLLLASVAYCFLLLGNYVHRLRFSIVLIIAFVYYRCEAIRYYIQRDLGWYLPPMKITKLLLGSYLAYFVLDQMADYR